FNKAATVRGYGSKILFTAAAFVHSRDPEKLFLQRQQSLLPDAPVSSQDLPEGGRGQGRLCFSYFNGEAGDLPFFYGPVLVACRVQVIPAFRQAVSCDSLYPLSKVAAYSPEFSFLSEIPVNDFSRGMIADCPLEFLLSGQFSQYFRLFLILRRLTFVTLPGRLSLQIMVLFPESLKVSVQIHAPGFGLPSSVVRTAGHPSPFSLPVLP